MASVRILIAAYLVPLRNHLPPNKFPIALDHIPRAVDVLVARTKDVFSDSAVIVHRIWTLVFHFDHPIRDMGKIK